MLFEANRVIYIKKSFHTKWESIFYAIASGRILISLYIQVYK